MSSWPRDRSCYKKLACHDSLDARQRARRQRGRRELTRVDDDDGGVDDDNGERLEPTTRHRCRSRTRRCSQLGRASSSLPRSSSSPRTDKAAGERRAKWWRQKYARRRTAATMASERARGFRSAAATSTRRRRRRSRGWRRATIVEREPSKWPTGLVGGCGRAASSRGATVATSVCSDSQFLCHDDDDDHCDDDVAAVSWRLQSSVGWSSRVARRH